MTDLVAVWVPALSAALLHFLWQGALLGMLAWLALALLRNARPQARYAVACMALALCALLPVWNLVAELSSAGDVPELMSSPGATADVALAPLADLTPARIGLPSIHTLPDAATAWIVLLWAIGAALLSLRLALGAWWLRDLRLQAVPEAGLWQDCVDRLAPRLGIRGTVAVRVVAAGDTPMVAGVWRPMVLLPAAVLARMPADLLEALLAHELAHVARHDGLVNLVQGALEALLFYHPVVWWLSHRIRIERELVADDMAARVTGQPRQLAIALSELDRFAAQRRAFPHARHALAAHGGHLMSRIRQLVRPERRPLGAATLFPLLGLVAAGMTFYAQAQLIDSDNTVVHAATGAPMRASSALATPGVAAAALPAASTIADPAPQARPGDANAAAAVRTTLRERGTGYALIRADREGFRMSGDLDDVDTIRATRRAIDGDFVWFRRDGRAWVVRDADTLARVEAASRRTDAATAEMDALERRMRPHSERMEALGARMEALQQQMDDGGTAQMEATSTRMQALGRELESLVEEEVALSLHAAGGRDDAGRPSDRDARLASLRTERERVERAMEHESDAMEALGRRMEAHSAPMEAVGREMEAAGRPMESIGREMEAVGRRIEREALVADAEIRRILDDAHARGLATPAPYAQ
ncbi:M56 family metallopeptidase [Luteimonas kalidii]|uniref:M56 family metallopeptidase n=1 Tax=Luteimonas kalidii TaxID=3042025 RepID=A0ABT6JS29_9GAMM|nr:M56 family metallopeptidase [Luteimonas kalidii]MDH5833494.1 M56 family metallopeptidase [Luteimonas kalidii]